MTPPPSDMGSIPWKPVIPERKYQHLDKVPYPADSFWQTHPLFSPPVPEASVVLSPYKIRRFCSLCTSSVPFLNPKLEQ